MGGKSKSVTIGKWYYVAYHHGLSKGPIDAFLEFRGGNKTAWQGELTSSGALQVNQPNLWGGEKDQGGMVGTLRVMFGEATQAPNAYLVSVFGTQTAAWRGMCTVAWEGGKFGAMNPYPQKPSYKVRRIRAGWDDDSCWYEAAAAVSIGDPTTLFSEDFAGGLGGYALLEGTLAPFAIVASDYGSALEVSVGPTGEGVNKIRRPASGAYGSNYFEAKFKVTNKDVNDYGLVTLLAIDGSELLTFYSGRESGLDALRRPTIRIGTESTAVTTAQMDSGVNYLVQMTFFAGQCVVSIKNLDTSTTAGSVTIDAPGIASVGYVQFSTQPATGGGTTEWTGVTLRRSLGGAMNPAHMLVFSRTQQELGREPLANINCASAEAAADWFLANGFGLCTRRKAASESPSDFEQRICRVAGCSFTRSVSDGQWYIDIANGEYDIDSLPILTDDDVLSFREIPTVLDNAVNSVSVKYFDPATKQALVTPPLRAMGLIASFGEIHQTYEYPEIPGGSLAARVAARELLSSITPTRAFELDTTRATYAWRPNQYFRLQLPKRGIDDMVCVVGELQHGQLKSGAIRLKAVQDVYSLPQTAYTQVEPGVDTRPSQIPVTISAQRAFEAPYVDVVVSLSRADLAALPDETGYLVAAAVDPAASRDFSMRVAPSGGSYAEVANGDFCPTALVIEAGDKATTTFTLSAGVRLQEVEVGSIALWDDELCVVDAIDAIAGTISLGRGCADTVPQAHAAESRLYFYGSGASAVDPAEHTDGETVDVKLLTNTASQQVMEADAAALSVTFDQRQFRPYPPADLQFTDDVSSAVRWPEELTGAVVTAWVHRDRIQQADQLVDTTAGSIGPEAGTTYTVHYEQPPGTEVHSQSGIAGTSAVAYTFPADGLARILVEAVRDSVSSWQSNSHEFDYLIGGPADPFYADVKALLNMGGADGSTTFTDQSPSPQAFVASGNAQIDTSLGFNAALFDGAGDYISSVFAGYAPGTGPFTAEFYFRPKGSGDHNDQHLLQTRESGKNGYLFQYSRSTGKLAVVSDNGITGLATANGAIVDLTEYHVAFTRDSSGDMRLFLNGSQVGSTFNSAQNFDGTTLFLSRRYATDGAFHYFNGHMRGVRITNDCRYASAFTPPPPPLPTS